MTRQRIGAIRGSELPVRRDVRVPDGCRSPTSEQALASAGPEPASCNGGIASSMSVARHHEVSILIAGMVGAGRYLGSQPAAKVSMMSMRPPQHGQGCGSTQG